jgi:hypothetical protein
MAVITVVVLFYPRKYLRRAVKAAIRRNHRRNMLRR